MPIITEYVKDIKQPPYREKYGQLVVYVKMTTLAKYCYILKAMEQSYWCTNNHYKVT